MTASARAVIAETLYDWGEGDERITDAILAALAKAGLAVVPVEPTEAMLQAGFRGWDTHPQLPMRYDLDDERETWAAMVEAARLDAAKDGA
jgi:hypothetical protein